jgi:prepilin-type N-terminal cleavage/methylation domain-containing protein
MLFPRHRFTWSPILSGFSLLELLVVIAIMGILASMTMAIGPGLLRSSAMSSSLSQVASAVSLARSEAIRSRKQTYFVLAPTDNLDERSFSAYAVMRKEASGTNFTLVSPWKKLRAGVLFCRANWSPILATNLLPYPMETDSAKDMLVISFVSDGSLDDDRHATKAVLPLQIGTRLSTAGPPDYQGNYVTNEINVDRMSGKVRVVREGEAPK